MEISSRRRRGSPRENAVPLINVVFLLLIFFLLTGTLRRGATDVTLPESDVSGPELDRARVVSLNTDGQVRVDGRAIATTELTSAVARSAGDTAPDWVLRADAEATATQLIPVLDALRRGGIERIDLAVRAGRGADGT